MDVATFLSSLLDALADRPFVQSVDSDSMRSPGPGSVRRGSQPAASRSTNAW